jgi:hypothetical protein
MVSELFTLLQPQNIHQEKKRLGPQQDGGYVMPVSVLEKCDALFTYGVGGETRYEEEFSRDYKKPVYMFDHTLPVAPYLPHICTVDENIKFFREGLGSEPNCRDFLAHYAEIQKTGEVFLKIDIEGGEYDYLLNVDMEALSKVVTGINLEFHWLHEEPRQVKMIEVMKRLNQYFVMNHIHANNWVNMFPLDGRMIPIVLEMSFINKRHVESFEPDLQQFPVAGLDWPNKPDAPDHKLEFLNWLPRSNQEIYISLTTVPKRLANWEQAQQNLDALLNQKTGIEYKVLLNLPKVHRITGEEYVISDELKAYAEANPRLIINRIEKDRGPIAKIDGFLAVSKNPEDIILVCDDDHVYHEDMLEFHLKKLLQYPNAAICFRGDSIVEKRDWTDENGVKRYMLRPTHLYFPVKEDRQLLVPGHWHSVSYRRKFFADDFEEVTTDLAVNDDISVGYYLKRRQVHIICAKWDKETDFRPVNDNGRPAHSFPIVRTLPHSNISGFHDHRGVVGNHIGTIDNNRVQPEMEDGHFKIYSE